MATSDSRSRQRTRLAVALPWLAGGGMILALLPTLPLALVAPELVLGNVPVFLLLILFAVSASRQARQGESTPVLVGAVLGGLVAVVVPMLWVTAVWLATREPLIPVVYLSMAPVLWFAGSGGALAGAAVGWLVRRARRVVPSVSSST